MSSDCSREPSPTREGDLALLSLAFTYTKNEVSEFRTIEDSVVKMKREYIHREIQIPPEVAKQYGCHTRAAYRHMYYLLVDLPKRKEEARRKKAGEPKEDKETPDTFQTFIKPIGLRLLPSLVTVRMEPAVGTTVGRTANSARNSPGPQFELEDDMLIAETKELRNSTGRVVRPNKAVKWISTRQDNVVSSKETGHVSTKPQTVIIPRRVFAWMLGMKGYTPSARDLSFLTREEPCLPYGCNGQHSLRPGAMKVFSAFRLVPIIH